MPVDVDLHHFNEEQDVDMDLLQREKQGTDPHQSK
jgi:hypothetical protein